jgi:hypothetical protein
MTAQAGEILVLDGEEVTMCTEPLDDYFTFASITPNFEANCTALWRGYVGTWEIVGERLYLISLSGTLNDGEAADLETMFPGFSDRVFAHWYSGQIRIPRGKLLKYVHGGYGSIYEADLLINFEKGVVLARRTKHNGTSDAPDDPDNPDNSSGYYFGAMTVFPTHRQAKDPE